MIFTLVGQLKTNANITFTFLLIYMFKYKEIIKKISYKYTIEIIYVFALQTLQIKKKKKS